MKYKRYILFLLLAMIIGVNKTYAALTTTDKCYYIGDELKGTFAFGPNYQNVYINVVGNKLDHDKEDLLNWRPVAFRGNETVAGHKFSNLNSSLSASRASGACPTYIVVQYCKVYKVWGTNDASEAASAAQGIDGSEGCIGRYASNRLNGALITSETYYSNLMVDVESGGHKVICDPTTDTNCDPTASCEAIFGNPTYAGTKDANGNYTDPPSLAYIIDTVLDYARILVPILIILLGSLDLAKAVTAGKEDEMRKAQAKFAKRILAGVILFFVPVIVNLVMKLADIAWEGLGYYTCTYK